MYEIDFIIQKLLFSKREYFPLSVTFPNSDQNVEKSILSFNHNVKKN